jgi:hypothetical protein
VAGSLMKNSVVEALTALKLETDARNALLKDIEKQLFKQGFGPTVEIKNLPMGKTMKMLVRVKRPAAVSFGKTAECKVYSSMAWERQAEWERAGLIRTSSTAPDNSEF